jgi:histidine triad (HIT) family protein
MTLFQKIAAGDIPAKFVHHDDVCIAFHDVNPQAPVHVLVVPREPIARIAQARSSDQALLGHLLLTAAKVASELGLTESGFRIVINNGKDGGESVPHLHVHVLGGRQMAWPPG